MVLEELTAFALAPDDQYTVDALGRGYSRDDALGAQGTWMLLQYMHVQDRRNEPPRFVLNPNRAAPPEHNSALSTREDPLDPLLKPVFMYCFLDHFTPSNPWTPVERKRKP